MSHYFQILHARNHPDYGGTSLIRAIIVSMTLLSACRHAGARESALEGAPAALFPKSPNPQLTPGAICSKPDEYRYPEHIAYCERNVSIAKKQLVFDRYDTVLGFKIRDMDRDEFKIDHSIPLCMGGANELSNLWPQHKTIYEQTDPIEEKLCALMARGQMLQKEALVVIHRIKVDFSQAKAVERELDGKLGSP